ncbi:MAG: type II toxin-antitoxin system ParD family antitoxin [Oscillatoria sp. SIO1A7]|nr:type II toxin-antitoxin system ParD family antitoxin [Oscillatoria sp. SIO1A7]
MNISLTPELEKLVNEKVKNGQYSSANEVIGAGLRLLEERDRLNQASLAELKAKIRSGIEASDRGEVVDGETVFAELEEDVRRIEVEMLQKKEAS